MTAEELYKIYAYHFGEEDNEWEGIHFSDKQSFRGMAEDITAVIDDAVVEAIPGTKAGERTDS